MTRRRAARRPSHDQGAMAALAELMPGASDDVLRAFAPILQRRLERCEEASGDLAMTEAAVAEAMADLEREIVAVARRRASGSVDRCAEGQPT